MHLIFNGVDTAHESTQTEISYLRELFATTMMIIVIMIIMIIIWKVERMKNIIRLQIEIEREILITNSNNSRITPLTWIKCN